MEIQMLKTTPPLLRGNRFSTTTLTTLDLPTLIEKVKSTHAWANGELSSVILLNKPDKQMVLAALHADTEIKSYQLHDSVTLQIIQGKLKFRSHKESVTLLNGQIFTLNEKLRYTLKTKEETILLLTILKSVFQTGEK